MKIPAICLAPEYLAEELLRLEGCSEVEYVALDQHTSLDLLMTNHIDISIYVPPSLLPDLDAAKPVVVLAGLHGGGYEQHTPRSERNWRPLAPLFSHCLLKESRWSR